MPQAREALKGHIADAGRCVLTEHRQRLTSLESVSAQSQQKTLTLKFNQGIKT